MAIWKRVRFVLLLVAGLLVLFVVARFRVAESKPDTGFSAKDLTGIQQVVVVRGENAGGTAVTVELYQRKAEDWERIRGPYSARIGVSGFRSYTTRTEGDGTTPIGIFPIPSAFGGDAKPGGTSLPYTVVTPGQCWISDTTSPAYNRWVTASPCTPPNVDLSAKSLPGQIFHLAIVIGFNTEFRRPGAGSALFFHIESLDGAGDAQATAGGIGLSQDHLKSLLTGLDPAKNPVAIMGPTAWVNSPDGS